MPAEPSGGSLGGGRLALRRASSLVTHLNVHQFLRREPAAFGQLYRDILRPIEGWRYRQDLVLLYLLARDTPGPEPVLEIGSYRGLSTTALALGLRDGGHTGGMHAVDPHTGDRQDLEQSGATLLPSEGQYRANIERAGIADHITTHVTTSGALAEGWDGTPLRVLFIDGWHSYDAVRHDIESWVPLVPAHGVVLIDDYRNYGEVRQAVDDMADVLPPLARRAGRMWLGHSERLSPAIERMLSIRWG